jgi:alpha-galactosidase
MVANGMRDAGYVYAVIDDTWSKMLREADGSIEACPVKFPSGIKALVDMCIRNG